MATSPDDAELGQSDSGSRTGPSLLQVTWQRKSLVILGLMVGLVLGLLYYAQRPPVYASTAQVLVVQKTPDMPLTTAYDGRMGIMNDYMSTQTVLLQSPAVIAMAARRPGMKELRSFPNEDDGEFVNAVREAIKVSRDSREGAGGAPNSVLTISLRGAIADECPSVVNAIVAAYTDFLNDAYKSVAEKAAKMILNARDLLSTDLEDRRKKFEAFRQLTPDLLIRTEGGGNIYTSRLAKIEHRRAELTILTEEQQQNYSLIKRTYDQQGKGVALQTLAAIGMKSPLIDNNLDRQLIELNLILRQKTQSFGPKHPEVVFLSEQIDMLKRLYGKGMGALGLDGTPVPPSGGGNGAVVPAPVEMDTVQILMAAMMVEIESKRILLKTLNDLFEKEQQVARTLTQYELEETRHKEGIESTRRMLDQIMNKVNELTLTKDSGGYEARLIHPPGLGRKVSPNPYQVFPLSAILGLAAGIGLAYLAEMSDKSFRTPEEIRRRLGLPVIGHIPFFNPDEKATMALASGEPVVDPMIVCQHQSNSVAAEAYRGVRTALYFNTQGVGHQVIQVTSPNVSDGKSTLAANLAVSIAQSGKRTIIIDGDCRKPRVHKIFNVPAETGLASVIAGTADLDSAIQTSLVPNLAVLPCGPRPANPAELLTSPRFKELLDLIRSKYDFIIIDTPPILVVTDPCVVAPRVDGVVLTIRVTKNGRPYAERAKEVLASLGANVIGVVVNGFGGQAGGRYGYEHYQYGYGYGYGYTYSYSYGYTEDESAKGYYRDPNKPESENADKKKSK